MTGKYSGPRSTSSEAAAANGGDVAALKLNGEDADASA